MAVSSCATPPVNPSGMGYSSSSASIQVAPTQATSSLLTDERKLLTIRKDQRVPSGYFDADENALQDHETNQDQATETVTYTQEQYNVTLSLPYNPEWGAPLYRYPPYEEKDNLVVFGPVKSGEGAYARHSYIAFTAPLSASEIESKVKGAISQKIINDLKLVKYSNGDEAYPAMFFIIYSPKATLTLENISDLTAEQIVLSLR